MMTFLRNVFRVIYNKNGAKGLKQDYLVYGNCIMSTDVDECSERSDNCEVGSTCVNTEGSFTCDGM